MIEAITRTNSRKPIGRWFDETPSALISVTAHLTESAVVAAMLRCTTHLPGWLLRADIPIRGVFSGNDLIRFTSPRATPLRCHGLDTQEQ
jgi:hypothetical protein